MTETDQLLRKVGKACAITRQDAAGRVVMQLTLDEAEASRLMAFGVESAECTTRDDDRPFREAPVFGGVAGIDLTEPELQLRPR